MMIYSNTAPHQTNNRLAVEMITAEKERIAEEIVTGEIFAGEPEDPQEPETPPEIPNPGSPPNEIEPIEPDEVPQQIPPETPQQNPPEFTM